MKRLLVLAVVVVGATFATTLAIQATDYLTAADSLCPVDMVPVEAVPGVLCVDRSEARATASCLHLTPDSPQATKGNLALATCEATGDGAGEPWRFIAREEAASMCARSGKRLPTAGEWYAIALASDTSGCVFDATRPVPAGETTCTTPTGVAHLPGNVWEWVSDDVIDAIWNGRTVPSSGYVASVDSSGIASQTSTTTSDQFGADYARFSKSGVFGMVRGGFYGSGEDGGIYALQANIAPTFASAGIGFRCVR